MKPGISRHEGGAISVIGLFMACFLTGGVWYVVGIASAVLYRERVQDAADAVAFAGAVYHARGMNIIATLNILMSALLGLLVTGPRFTRENVASRFEVQCDEKEAAFALGRQLATFEDVTRSSYRVRLNGEPVNVASTTLDEPIAGIRGVARGKPLQAGLRDPETIDALDAPRRSYARFRSFPWLRCAAVMLMKPAGKLRQPSWE